MKLKKIKFIKVINSINQPVKLTYFDLSCYGDVTWQCTSRWWVLSFGTQAGAHEWSWTCTQMNQTAKLAYFDLSCLERGYYNFFIIINMYIKTSLSIPQLIQSYYNLPLASVIQLHEINQFVILQGWQANRSWKRNGDIVVTC